MGRHTFRDAVGVRGGLLRGWDVEFSVDLVDPDIRRRPPAADVVADRRFPGVLDVVTAIASTTEQLIQRGQWVDVAPGMVAMFGGMVALTQRELIAHLLETEADWPWVKQPTKQ